MTEVTDTLDIPHLRGWIGREEEAEEILTAALVQRYHATFDLPGASDHGAPAPRLIHWCLTQPAAPTGALGPDGHPARGGFLPPVPLPRRMRAGGSVAFHRDLRVGDRVRRVSRITDVVLKEGRTGTLCFVTVENTILVDGQVVLAEAEDIVYRGEGGGVGKEPAPAEAGSHHSRIDASAPLLFRYSALTFNGHRIHYDRRYATEVEHYPGLVVHGPLQSALLLNLATRLHGRPPDRFGFRSHSTLFDSDPVLLNSREENGKLILWTARENGPVAMMAEASWKGEGDFDEAP